MSMPLINLYVFVFMFYYNPVKLGLNIGNSVIDHKHNSIWIV